MITNSAKKANNITTDKIIAIIIDKSIIDNKTTINDVKKYIQKNKNDKILIVTGYSNTSYCFFKILDITNGKYLPNFNQTDYERFQKEKGYCVAFCQKTGQINGKSFKGDVDYTKIMELIQFTLKNKKSPDKIVKILGG